MIKLISHHYYYGVVIYSFTHPMKWNIYRVTLGICKYSHQEKIICKGLKKMNI